MINEHLVSIGVPVYNDAPWLRNSLDHLINQDYSNLEIILADDGSKDGSREICREYAGYDKRICYFENKHNLGAIENHKLVFDVSKGNYFAWGSGHDYYLPTFVSRMLEQLNINPSVNQCNPKSQTILNGKPYIPPGLLDTRGLPPVERVKTLMQFRLAGGSLDIFYGLFRSEFLAKVDLARDAVSADEVWLAEFCLLGEILQIDEILLHKINTRGETNVRANRASYRAHLDKNKLSKGNIFKEYLPRLYSFVEYMNMVENSHISLDEKEWLYKEIKNYAANFSATIMDELEYFIEFSKADIIKNKTYHLVGRITAAQVLNALDFAIVLGFDHHRIREFRSICLDTLELAGQTLSIRMEHYHNVGEKAWKTARNYRQRLLNSINRFLGRK